MNSNDRYEKIPLTPSIAKDVIIKLFAGKDPVKRSTIIEKVTEHYTKNGGLEPGGDPVSLFKKALSNLKSAGRAENFSSGYWKILPIAGDENSEDPLSGTESEDESVKDLVENLLEIVKAEIHNLNEEIEALKRQKSHLEENLTKFSRIWQDLSRK